MRRRIALPLVIVLAAAAGGAGSVAQEASQEPQVVRLAPPPGQDEARQQIQALREELKRLATRQAQSSRDVAGARAKLDALNVRESALTAELGRDRNRLARLLGALQLFRRQPPPALLVSPQDARDAVRAAILIRAMTPALENRAKGYAAEAREIATLRRQAAAADAERLTAESVAADRWSEIERLMTEQAAIEKRYADEAFLAGRAAGSPGQLADSFPRIIGTDAGPGGITRPPGALVRRFRAPAPGGGQSDGLAFKASAGDRVLSPTQGVVEFAGPVTGWGVVLILRTSGSYHLVLAGMSEVSVAPGQSVATGAPVGKIADGGRSEPELYLELRRSGAPIDPTPWLGEGGQRQATTP